MKELLFEQEARNKILAGVNKVADAVALTLGPRGQNVIFEESVYPTITKDGVTVAQQVFLEDKFENMGVMISREAAENTNREAGDGTTTTIVLLRDMFEQGLKAVASGMNPILLKRGMDVALEKILKHLEKQTKKVTTDKEKEQVATIAANNDEQIGKLIAGVIKKVGENGIVTVTNSNSLKTDVDYVSGTKMNSGYESHIFVNNPKRMSVVIEKPVIIICTDVINMQAQLTGLLERILPVGIKNMVLFADKVEGQALAFLAQNYMQGKFTCVPVKIPSFGGYQKDLIYDLAALTNATVLGIEDTMKIEDAEAEQLGFAENIIITRNSTIISGTPGNIKGRIEGAKALLKDEKDIFAIEKLKDRIGRLQGSVANIQVGGATESEQTELKYRIEDALNATKAAVEEGIVEGGGMALIGAYNDIETPSGNREYITGHNIVYESLKKPLERIASNGGQSGEAIVGKVLDHGIGYNALTDNYENLFKAGIVDPTKVVRNEIQNAVSTAGILLTSGCAIAIKDIKK